MFFSNLFKSTYEVLSWFQRPIQIPQVLSDGKQKDFVDPSYSPSVTEQVVVGDTFLSQTLHSLHGEFKARVLLRQSFLAESEEVPELCVSGKSHLE